MVNLINIAICYRRNKILRLTILEDIILQTQRIFAADMSATLLKLEGVYPVWANRDVRHELIFSYFCWKWIEKWVSFNLIC